MSVLWYQAWHAMKEKDVINPSDLELKCFAINLYKKLYYLTQRFHGSHTEIVLGIDSREWRSNFFLESHIKTQYSYYRSKSKREWVVTGDGNWFHIYFDEEKEMWVKKSPSKALREALNISDLEKWVFFDLGETPSSMVEANPDIFLSVYDCPEWPELNKLIKYKGGRASDWEKKYMTTKKDFKIHAEKLTYNLANTFGLACVKADWAEFDDIANVWNAQSPASNNVIITSDHDLHQEMLRGTFTKVFDARTMQWVEKTKELEILHFLCKLVGGDTSDNLSPITVTFKDKEKRLGGVSWTVEDCSIVKGGKNTVKWVENLLAAEGGLAGAHKWLMENQLYNSYEKNYIMMNLACMPSTVRDSSLKALETMKVGTKEYEMEKYGVEPLDLEELAELAEAARRNDLRLGFFETMETE